MEKMFNSWCSIFPFLTHRKKVLAMTSLRIFFRIHDFVCNKASFLKGFWQTIFVKDNPLSDATGECFGFSFKLTFYWRLYWYQFRCKKHNFIDFESEISCVLFWNIITLKSSCWILNLSLKIISNWICRLENFI